MRLALAFLILALSSWARSAPAPVATGDYRTDLDLGQIYAAMMEARLTNDICAEMFPNLADSNDAAYAQWRRKHRTLLQEIQRGHAALLWQQAGQEPQQHILLLAQMDDFFTQQKKALREKLARDGREALRAQCTLYPVFLTTEAMSLETYFSEQIKSVRQHSKTK